MAVSAVPRRLRLAYVITGLELGGGGAVVLTIARALDFSRFSLDVFCILEGGVLEDELRSLGCGVTVLPRAWDYRRRLLPYSPTKTWQLASMLRRGQYDVVHTHLFPADAIGRVAGRLAGIPVMVKSLHNMGRWKTPRQVLTDRVLGRWTDKVICCSDFQREVATAQERIPPGLAVTIHHGARLERFDTRIDRAAALSALGLSPERLTIGTVGRAIPEKGHACLVDAVPAILEQHPNVQFLIVGEGGQRAALERQVAGAPYRDRICFAGARADVPEMLSLMDVFVFPSLSEGFGIAVIEAMTSRLPVIASNIRPLSDIVVAGETGLLVEPGDSGALAAAVNRLAGDAGLRRKLGEAGRARVERRYTDRHMVRAHEELYVDLYRAAAARRGQIPDPLLCH